jgi:hypothetical protein
LIMDILSASVTHNASPENIAIEGGSGLVDYSISLGNLLTIASFLVFVTVYVVNSRGAAKILSSRLGTVDSTMIEFKLELKKLSEVLIGQAQQDGRINLLEQRLMQEGKRLDTISESLGDFKNIMLADTLKRSS